MKATQIKVLAVDDEPDILELIRYNLEKEGFAVETASNGAEGLERARSFSPDLILLDVMMPEIDGMEVCRTLRQEEKFGNTLIAFLTARSEDYSQIAGFDAGADDYITKPIRPRVLVSRVKGLLRRSKVAEDSHSKDFGDLRIDRETYLAYLKEEPITLARKEFELLYLLSSKPGKVFTRDEIYERIWGADLIVGERTIDVHIRKIREKLGSHYIKTVKGIGYKFEF